jgi:Ser/Thr protein kinase RdoA (MazF antagonist)
MRLSLMSRFFETADEGDVHSPIADLIAARWVERDAVVEHWRSSANFVFSVRVPAGSRYYLRFNHSSERTVEGLHSEAEFLQHVSSQGIRVALSVKSRSGRFIETVATDLGDFHAMMFEAIPGECKKLDEMDQEGMRRWGQALGSLHQAAQGFRSTGRPTWQEHTEMVRRFFSTTNTAALSELRCIEAQLGAIGDESGGFGLIHFDFELDNIIWQESMPCIIDFDDCAYYWYEADIAFALRDLYDDRASNVDLTDDRLVAFIAGYRTQRELTTAALENLPLFVRLHNLIMCAKLYRALGDGPLRPEPDWTSALRKKLKAIIERMNRDSEQEPICLNG